MKGTFIRLHYLRVRIWQEYGLAWHCHYSTIPLVLYYTYFIWRDYRSEPWFITVCLSKTNKCAKISDILILVHQRPKKPPVQIHICTVLYINIKECGVCWDNSDCNWTLIITEFDLTHTFLYRKHVMGLSKENILPSIITFSFLLTFQVHKY